MILDKKVQNVVDSNFVFNYNNGMVRGVPYYKLKLNRSYPNV